MYAKPVGIPIVPELPKQENIVKMESKLPAVSPHKINNFVYEEDNRIILDFGPNNVVTEDRTHSPSSESSKSSSGNIYLFHSLFRNKRIMLDKIAVN